MKWLYIKNGDVVEQFQQYLKNGKKVSEGGPGAFVEDFLQMTDDQPTVMISCHNVNRVLEEGLVKARVYPLHIGFNGALGKLIAAWQVTLLVLIKVVRFKPDRIVCGRTGFLLWLSYVYSSIFHIPLIHSRHNRVIEDGGGGLVKIRRYIDSYVLRRLKASICHGPYLKQELLDVGISLSKVVEFDVGYSANMEAFSIEYIPEMLHKDIEFKWVTFVGRVQRNKGVFDLLNAMENILTKSKNIRLLFLGDGPDLIELKKEISSKNLDLKVRVLGRVLHPTVLSVVAHSGIVVTPTKSSFPEGRCMSAMEGLAYGVPVIAPDFGPFPYLIEHGKNGFLFLADNVSDLKVKLEIALSDGGRYDKLKSGAKEMSEQLRVPERIFSVAINEAFDIAMKTNE